MAPAPVVKVDLRRELVGYRARLGRFDLVTLPPRRYLAVDGAGDPNTSTAYADAVSTVYPVAYSLKAVGRARHGRDHVVMPLEAQWWADDPSVFTTRRDKASWSWTVLILVPDWLTDDDVAEARRAVAARGRGPALEALRVAVLDEGLVVQTLHVGPYDDEGPVLAQLHDEVLPARGLRPTGRHHEVYLGDPRRSAPVRLRTILRQPVERVGMAGDPVVS